MAVINILTQPPQGASVFNQMFFEFAWEQGGCSFVDVNTLIAAIDVSIIYDSILFINDKVKIINGAYAGTYTVTDKVNISANITRLTLNTLFIGNSLLTGSNLFAPERSMDFQLFTGYQLGAESNIKPWSLTSTIRVSQNTQGIYRFDISGFLQSRFDITNPLLGPNIGASLRYLVRVLTSGVPSDSNARTAYYGLQNLSLAQQEGSEAVGERPILFFGNVPTLYSLTGAKGIINNFISNPNQSQITASGAVVKLDLLSCEAKEVLYIAGVPTSLFTVNPALPDWITATSEGDNIKLIINPCSGGVGDYLLDDYNPVDYLSSGQLNSVTGCFSFVFSLGGSVLFTLNICVTPVSEIVNVCKSDVLNFAWLNEIGGFSSFAIESRFIKGRDFGSEQTIVTSARVLKRVEYKDVYNTFQLSGGVLSKNQLDLLQSLRSSIQAFLYNNLSQAWDIPIVIDRGSFLTYGNRFNQSETRFSFRFRVSQQVRIQTQ